MATILIAAASAGPVFAGQVSGTATYRERIALPPDAVFEAVLQDVSRADAPAVLLGSAVRDPAGQPPFRFRIAYDDRAVQPGHRYAVRATVRHQGRLLFTTDTHVPALDGSTAPVQLRLVQVSAAPPASATVPDSPLRNTYWKLVQLLGAPVTVVNNQREPHLLLSASEPRLSGSGGCNGLLGGFEVSGEQLRFKEMGSTMMACAEGMAQETAFLRALGSVVRHHIQGQQLELLDATDRVVARLESVALR